MTNNTFTLYHEYFGSKSDECIVFIHGFLGSNKIWETFIPKFKANYFIITIDLPGHGKTPHYEGTLTIDFIAEEVRSILEFHKVKKVHFMGHSMGGYVSLAFLNNFPEMVYSITLLNSTAKEDSEQKKKDRLLAMKVFDLQPSVFIQAAIENLFYKENLNRLSKEVKNLQEIALKTSVEGAKAALLAMRNRNDHCDLIKNTGCPILYIAGKEDTTVPFDSIQEQIKDTNVQLIAIEQSGHMGFVESFEETLNGFKNFIQSIQKK